MANNGLDEEPKSSSHKLLWTLLLVVLGVQLYIITRPAEPPPKTPGQSSLQAQVAPALPSTSNQATDNTQRWDLNQHPDAQRNSQQPTAVQHVGNVDIVPMAFKVSGRLNKLYVSQNAQVKQGDLLATLDPAPFEKSVADARVRLKVAQEQEENLRHLPNPNYQGIEAARANIESAQHIYDGARQALLEHKKVLVNAQTDNVDQDNIQNEHDAKLNLEKAYRELSQQEAIGVSKLDQSGYLAAVQIARNSLDDAEYDLDHVKMLAPSDGTITAVNIESGAILPSGTPVFTLAVPQMGR